ncbi:MAG: hypothetical protein WCA63_02810 [Gallionella sp.]
MNFIKLLYKFVAIFALFAAATESHAIPAFARQVGVSCSACHFQHFPVLNEDGRAFKAGGFTLMRKNPKIEDEGLSLPATLNLAFVTNLAYTKSNGTSVPTSSALSKDANNGQFQMTQYSLFMGGRVGENIGFEGEIGLTGTNVGGVGLASVKFPFIYELADVKAGVVPFTTNGLGAAQGFELFNTGAVAVHLFNQQDMSAISAQQYINTATPASGAAFVASSKTWFVNFSKWMPDTINGHQNNPGDPGAGSPTSNYLRIATTPGGFISGFDLGIGAQFWNGTSSTMQSAYANGPLAGTYETKAAAIDAQLLGDVGEDVGELPLTLIVSYATAPANAPGAITSNLFNQGTDTRKSFNIGAELGVIPNKATIQLGIRKARSGQEQFDATGVAIAGTNASDNAIMLGATYSLALNVRAEITFSKYSGDAYGAGAQAAAAATPYPYVGDRLTTVNVWMDF